MKFYSTNLNSPNETFSEAVKIGLAPDNGLYFPERIPKLSSEFFEQLKDKSLPEIAFEVARPYVDSEMDDNALKALLKDALDFEIPLVEVEENIYSLELYHGPTLAFKDVGARFMSRCLRYFNKDKCTVLVATSGDTGSAVAHGFLGVEGIDVVILYPSGKVSQLQEQQLTTLGQNITTLEVDGTFDDCQHLVKQAFLNSELKKEFGLTSANSINVARWLPQSFYYFWAMAQLPKTDKKVVFSVPSGNFGNITAGMMGQKMGLAINHFIAATNANNVVPNYLETGNYSPKPSVATISNAMDVGAPSNFVRMQHIFGEDFNQVKNTCSGFHLSDEATKDVMRKCQKETGYILDPHGAIGYEALKQMQQKEDIVGVFLETAHPAKFKDVVEETLNQKVEVPKRLADCMDKKKVAQKMSTSFDEFVGFLRNR